MYKLLYMSSLYHNTIALRENQCFRAKNIEGEIKMKQEEIREWIMGMLEKASLEQLRQIYIFIKAYLDK